MGFMEGYNMTAGNRQMRLAEAQFAQQSALEQQRANMAMAKFSEEQQDRIKKESDAAKSAEYFFKANPEGLAALGETPETFKNKSAGDRYAAMVAYGQAMMAREQQQKMQATAQSAQSLANFSSSYRNVQTPMNVPAGTFGPLSQQETIGGQPLDARAIFDISQRAGMNPLDGAKLMKEFGDASAGAVDRAPVMRQIGGHNVMFSPSTGKYDLLDRGSQQSGMSFDQKVQLMDRQALLRSKANLEKSISLLPKDSELHTDASAKLDSINAQLGGAAPEASVPKADVKEVTRFTKDGRKAVFDSNTKQFLRYAE